MSGLDVKAHITGLIRDVLDSGTTLDSFVAMLSEQSNPITQLVNAIVAECSSTEDAYAILEQAIEEFAVVGEVNPDPAEAAATPKKALESSEVSLNDKISPDLVKLQQFLDDFRWTTDKCDCGDPAVTCRALFNKDIASATLSEIYEVAVLACYKDARNQKKRLSTGKIIELLDILSPSSFPAKLAAKKLWLKEYVALFGEFKGDSSWDTTEKLNKRVLPTVAFYGVEHMEKVCGFSSGIFG